ncbi:hypothetical protein J1N35_015413 [Gossypium stocksii]|uniref:MULE transposase domain-containing protein n=1 Tax=Gossypium stocksii TaxID=47602 RepID=A0A9D3VWC4_9ROSI|nr:hypothetical protein J1N35_015413 [Gossypium stocksii]
MAMVQLYGDYNSSYNELQGWIAAMREYVPAIVIELQTRPYYDPDDQLQSGKRIFHQMFWTFDPCVRAFPYCKPFVQILLLAVAQDGNRNVLSIAFAIVDKENLESWEFFLTNLRRYVIRNDNICIISDRGKGLIAAIRHSGVPWRSVYCICHIVANFHRDYKNADWKRQVVAMAIFSRLTTVMPRMGQQQVDQMEAEHVFVEDVKDAMVVNIEWRELISGTDGANVGGSKHFIIHVRMSWQRVLRGLRRNPRGRPQSSRIRNEMDIMEKSDCKHFGLCKLVGHNQNKYPHRNYHVGQSSRSGRN